MATLLLICLATGASAALTRIAGPTHLLHESRTVYKFDVAFDTTNRVYLLTWGTQAAGPVNGQFVSEAGAPIGAPFAISAGSPQSGWARVVYSAEQGKFLVSYVKIVGLSLHQKAARFVTYSGGSPVLGNEIIIDGWAGGAGTESGMAYSAAGGRFFVTWWKWQPSPVSYVTVIDGSEQILATYPLTNPGDGQSDPEIACDPASNRCLIAGLAWGAFSAGNPATWGRFINGTTGVPEGPDSFYLATSPNKAPLEDQTIAPLGTGDQFLVAYGRSGIVFGNIANPAASTVGAAYVVRQSSPSTVSGDGGGYGGTSLIYNPGSRTTLLVSLTFNGLVGVDELDGSGIEISGALDFVPNPRGDGRPNPWDFRSKFGIAAANAPGGQFLVLDNDFWNDIRATRYSTLPACAVTPSPTSASFPTAGGDATVALTATGSTCAWTATSNASWLTITSATSGAGSATLSYTAAPSNTTVARTGTMTIAGQTFTVSQAGVPCNYAINPTGIAILNAAADGTINVTASAPAGVTGPCPWSATSNTPAVMFQNATGRTSSGPLPFSVTTNTSTVPRAGTATIAGHTFTMTQNGAPLNPAVLARENTRADFDGDGFNDLIWQDTSTGYLAAWALNGGHIGWTPKSFPHQVLDNNWRIVGTGDFTGDGKADIVWHNRVTGAMYLWSMNGILRTGGTPFSFGGEPDIRWKVVGVGDFNGDHKPDIVWQHDTGWLTVFLMDGATLIESRDLTPGKVQDPNWRIVGVADLNADDASDLIFQHMGTGVLAAWIMSGTTRAQYLPFFPTGILDLNWRLAAVLDINGDQAPDLVWQNPATGGIAVWYMTGTARLDGRVFPWTVGPNWMIVGPK